MILCVENNLGGRDGKAENDLEINGERLRFCGVALSRPILLRELEYRDHRVQPKTD